MRSRPRNTYDALPDFDGLSFAVIKGFRLIEKTIAEGGTNLEMMAIAFDDEQQAIAAERDIGDNPPPPDRDSELVRKEVEATIAAGEQMFPGNTVPLRFTDGKLRGGPPGDGTGMMFPVMIGARGHLSKQQARHAGKLWRAATQQYPKAYFFLDFPGYGEDKRPPWELAEVRRYIRWWARYAGMDDLDTADRFVGTRSTLAHAINYFDLRFLLLCGVFGEKLRQQAEIGILPTYAGKA
jgi:hypothetical protein